MANAVLDLAGTPALVALGTQDLVVGTAGSGRLKLFNNGVEVGSIRSNGIAVLNAQSLDADVTAGAAIANTPGYFASGTVGGTAIAVVANGADASGAEIKLFKTRSTALDANTIVAAEDSLGQISFWGADGAVYRTAAAIRCYCDATPGSNDMPTRLSFWTTPDGSGTLLARYGANRDGDFYQDGNGRHIILTNASTAVAQPAATGLTAAGSSIADALALTSVYNEVTTTAASTGVKLWDAPVGTLIYIRNGGANALNVYPHGASGILNGGSAGAAVSIAATAFAIAARVSSGAAGRWIVSEPATA